MVPYAGQEISPKISHARRSFMMFRAGKDTAFIADHFKLSEAIILRWITEERSRELSLSDPYATIWGQS